MPRPISDNRGIPLSQRINNMAGFEDLVNKLSGFGGDIPEGYGDELRTAYNDDIAARDAKVVTVNGDLDRISKERDAHAAEVTRVKAKNFDLLMSGKSGDNVPDPKKGDGQENNSSTISIDDLFKVRK